MLTNTGTGDNIMKLSERDSEKHNTSVERLKKLKKVVDKLQKQWYDIKVVAENETTAKNLDNWTVKQPWKILKVNSRNWPYKTVKGIN